MSLMSKFKRPLLLLTDSLSTRVFFSSGIVQRVWLYTNGTMDIVALYDIDSVFSYRQWLDDSCKDLKVISSKEYLGISSANPKDFVCRQLDKVLDKYFGFFPLAVRFCVLHKYHLERLKKKHPNSFLNLSLAFPLPRSEILFTLLKKWFFSKYRFVPQNVRNALLTQVSVIITSNLQTVALQNYLNGAYQHRIPVIGHIGSWDHPVGKGVIFPYCKNYIVHNMYMYEKLVEQHDIKPENITISGWPQMDPFAIKRSISDFESLLQSYGLDPGLPCILIAGNSEGNAPYEPAFVERFVGWWINEDRKKQYSLIFRPHPRDIIKENWKKRFGFLLGKKNIYVQSANYADIDVLSLLLQHVRCVITNAGTILLDSLVNDRPVVCVLYDEGGPADCRFAKNNVVGDHYKSLLKSGAFTLAYSFEDVLLGVGDAIMRPERLKEDRKKIANEIAGVVDGKSGERVANIIIKAIVDGKLGIDVDLKKSLCFPE
jgi:hypothetical protein